MDKSKLEKNLRDFEGATGIVGSFIINFPEGEVLATTMVSELPSRIINEVFGVEATFESFAQFLQMGNLRHYILEGPKGIILISKIKIENTEQSLFFLGIGGEDLNLPLIKIALLDFYKKLIN